MDSIEHGAVYSASHDKQLQHVALEAVLEKRRLDQALNAKEFAVCAGISYSTARHWFRLPGFPAICGVVFWQDFVQWRVEQTRPHDETVPSRVSESQGITSSAFPPRATQLLHDA